MTWTLCILHDITLYHTHSWCRECAKDEGMVRLVPDIVDADDGAAGLLIECRGWDESCLKVSPFRKLNSLIFDLIHH